ncbi:MAG: hypothetical protein KF773_10905 [Deltaproteobacteria bacterium]|nr:hypothetical protein [Deltaproteobacteria bacterium]
MRFRELRRIVQTIVLAGLPAAGCTSLYSSDCVERHDESIEIPEPAEPSMQLKIESCRRDVDACTDLCLSAMQKAGLGGSYVACEVTFRDKKTVVDLVYDVTTGGPNCPVDGRRPAGLAALRGTSADSEAGAWLAHAAWLEAASVHAFVHLANELAGHGAPDTLVRAALAAAADEVRHTELMTRLALRHGGRPVPPEVALPPVRGLADIAIENAAEGCVRETWGAIVALWQSHTALDPVARATFAAIARDELRHAQLAWAVDAWCAPRLDDADRARVVAAREHAMRELMTAPEPITILAIGLPDADQVRDLLSRTAALLWSSQVGGRTWHA